MIHFQARSSKRTGRTSMAPASKPSMRPILLCSPFPPIFHLPHPMRVLAVLFQGILRVNSDAGSNAFVCSPPCNRSRHALDCSVMSSFESMAPTLKPSDWSPHSAVMYSNPIFYFQKCFCVVLATVSQPPHRFSCNHLCMYERNYPCDNLIAVYFGVLFPAAPPASPLLLQKFTYLCMIAQVCLLAVFPRPLSDIVPRL